MELLFVTSTISLPIPDRVIKDTEELSRKDAPKTLIKGEKVKVWPSLKDCKDVIDTNSNAYKALGAFTHITSLRANANTWLSSISFSTPIARCVNAKKKDEIVDKFTAYEHEFNALVSEFIDNFDYLSDFWADQCDQHFGHDWGDLVRKYKLSPEKLRASFKFNLLTYSVSSEDGLASLEQNLSNYMYDSLVSYVIKFFGKKKPGDKVQTGSLTIFSNELVSYLESYAFLDPQLAEVKNTVESIMNKLWLNHWTTSSKKTMILDEGHGLWKIQAMLGSPQAIEALKASSKPSQVSFARPKLQVKAAEVNADAQKAPQPEDNPQTSPVQASSTNAPSPMTEAMSRLRGKL